ncbi:4,5-DOPA dioxygenase extradiol [Paramyrothecium foliicola]|nr:4,5-DOPA dioxygenase extradiol [Paramyrothecium foliicola]
MYHQSDDAVSRLQDTVADRRLSNAIYRHEQVKNLQKALVESRLELINAICQDLPVDRCEAFAELFLTISATKSYLDSISPVNALDEEYHIARNEDSPQARRGVGIVIIEPQSHTPLFSVVSPLCGAISSGSAVLLILKKTLDHLPPILTQLLTESLDPGIVEIISSKPPEIPASLYVRQTTDQRLPTDLSSPLNAFTVAVIDRTANLEDAARTLWRARTAFGGTSPYAPDIIFVNEFAKQALLDALIACYSQSHVSQHSILNDSSQEEASMLKSVKCVVAGTWGQILEVTDRNFLTSFTKPQGRTFYLHAYRSLVDAIEMANGLSSIDNRATFAFGDAKSCKYVLQGINADAGFANTVPTELLVYTVGPAAPQGHPIKIKSRYSSEMFSIPQPQYAKPTELSSVLDLLVSKDVPPERQLQMLERLRPEKRRPARHDVGMSLTPVHIFSHGSTMMLGEESQSADYWKKCGEEALSRGIKGVMIMGAHWSASQDDAIDVSTNPKPNKSPVAYVHPDKYKNYQLNPDLTGAELCISKLRAGGFNARGNSSFDWIHDTYLILIRMFPGGCPPTTIISMNPYFDPHYHMRVGLTLRPLRAQGYLLIGSGGAVHNLFRNVWDPMILYGDNFAQPTPPEPWALEFRQSVEDVIRGGGGPRLRRAMTSLMKHPLYRDAHATDDHFMPLCFAAGAAGGRGDEGEPGTLGAEDWELTNMCNSQFTVGTWNAVVA